MTTNHEIITGDGDDVTQMCRLDRAKIHRLQAAAKRGRRRPTPPAVPVGRWALVTLCGGPFAGQTRKVPSGPTALYLTTRRKRNPRDKPPVSVYRGDPATGTLSYETTLGEGR